MRPLCSARMGTAHGAPKHGSAEHTATSLGHRHPDSAVVTFMARRGLTVLAADERLAHARCARDNVTARSRSQR